jgi:hypothetical protein
MPTFLRLRITLLLPLSFVLSVMGQNVVDNEPAPSPAGFSRWLAFDQFSYNASYENTVDTYGRRVFDTGQQQLFVQAKAKLDKRGKYYIGFQFSSGSGFAWSYSTFAKKDIASIVESGSSVTPPQKLSQVISIFKVDPIRNVLFAGSSSGGWSTTFRDLYISASPVDDLTFEYGAMPMERGAGSSLTSFDDQQNMIGGRLSLKSPQLLWLDSLSAGIGYVGDPLTPGLQDRGDRFKQTNYWQIVAQRHLGKRLTASLDYSTLEHTHTLRQAVALSLPEPKFLDIARAELYQRMNTVNLPGYVAPSAHGWAVSASKAFGKRYAFSGGFSDIDPDYGVYTGSSLLTVSGFPVNGSAYQIGQRFFGKASLRATTYVTLYAFFTHEISPQRSPLYFDFNRQGLNAGISLDFRNIFSRLGWL